MVYAYEMIIDGVSSLQYGYLIAKLGNSVSDGMGTSEVNTYISNPLTSNIRLVKSGEKEVLKFGISLAKNTGDNLPISVKDRDILDFWLTGKDGLRRIEFSQQDHQGLHYMGRINNITWKNVSNQIVSCEFEIETDSPYGHRNDEVITFTTKTFSIHNPTHGDRWTYPTIKITMDTSGSDISIKNVTDKDREFTMAKLVANEIIEIDCRSGRIVSSTELNRVQQCNLKYPRLAYGTNEFIINGNMKSIEFVYNNDVRVGA